ARKDKAFRVDKSLHAMLALSSGRIAFVSQRWLQPLLIAVLGLIFFAPLVLHPTEVLYSDHSDLLAEHLPAKRFLVRSLRETGELPLWCPYSFSGASFIHDIQAQIMYPPHWLLFLLPEKYVGAGLSW